MHKLYLWGIIVNARQKQQLNVSQIALLVKYFLYGKVCILNSSGNSIQTWSYHLSCRGGGLQGDQNSLIMLSLDLPTPTHFTEMRHKEKERKGRKKTWLAVLAKWTSVWLQLLLWYKVSVHEPGTCRKSSMKRMYFCACTGRSSKLRAASVLQHQPGNVSYSTDTRVKTSMFATLEADQ